MQQTPGIGSITIQYGRVCGIYLRRCGFA